jgi:hypothetical protein
MICLGAQTYDEAVTLAGVTPITLQGLSPAQSILTALGVSGAVALTVRGVTIQSVSLGATGTASFVASAVGGNTTGQPGLRIGQQTGTLAVTLDGVEATGDKAKTQPAVGVYFSNQIQNLTLLVQNSYVHGAGTGVMVSAQPSTTGHVSFVNDTFTDDGTALDLTLAPGLPLSFFNNLITRNTLGVTFPQPADATDGNNALFGNTNNYGGSAADGAGYVKSDPMLDSSTTPPGLEAASPCRGAGDAAHAPATDFWGRPRGTKVDIGAVQSP